MTVTDSPFNSKKSAMHTPFPTLKEEKGRKDKWDPELYEYNPALQEGLNCASLRDPIRLKLILDEDKWWSDSTHHQVPPELFKKASKSLELLKEYRDMIEHHVNFRVALFFQQAVACHNTPFHFEIPKTEGQYFSAPGLKIEDSHSGKTKRVRYEAAHSGTLPGLKACLRSEYDASLTSGPAPRYFTYLPWSHMETMHNSTNGLPDFVNKIDTLIDAKAQTKDGLRYATIGLINQVAQGILTPTLATRHFLNHMEAALVARPAKSKSLTPAKIKIIEHYKEAVKELKTNAAKPLGANGAHPFFDSLLNVNVTKDKREDSAKIRRIVYQRKYELIRESLFSESKIQKLINTRFPEKDQTKKHFLRCALIYFVRNDDQLCKALEKQFSISLPGLKEDSDLIHDLRTYVIANNKQLNLLVRDIRATVRGYQKMERAFQAMLLHDLRVDLRDLRQSDLTAKITDVIAQKILKEKAKTHPDREKIRRLRAMPNSPSTISRLENSRIHIQKDFKTPENQRRKPLTLHYAKVVAKALEVDKGHFFSSFFASEEG